ncbi:MAG: hypothetical protein F6K31_35020 [Symploca sp. SIO2G7]|nr:hypothetical protein [Symploca sp. SIO2G7]
MSLVIGHWSLVICYLSLVIGPLSLVISSRTKVKLTIETREQGTAKD